MRLSFWLNLKTISCWYHFWHEFWWMDFFPSLFWIYIIINFYFHFKNWAIKSIFNNFLKKSHTVYNSVTLFCLIAYKKSLFFLHLQSTCSICAIVYSNVQCKGEWVQRELKKSEVNSKGSANLRHLLEYFREFFPAKEVYVPLTEQRYICSEMVRSAGPRRRRGDKRKSKKKR